MWSTILQPTLEKVRSNFQHHTGVYLAVYFILTVTPCWLLCVSVLLLRIYNFFTFNYFVSVGMYRCYGKCACISKDNLQVSALSLLHVGFKLSGLTRSLLPAEPSHQPQAPASKIIHNIRCAKGLFLPTVECCFYVVFVCSPRMGFWAPSLLLSWIGILWTVISKSLYMFHFSWGNLQKYPKLKHGTPSLCVWLVAACDLLWVRQVVFEEWNIWRQRLGFGTQ